MYGLINQAVHDLIVSKFGQGAWNEIAARAGVGDSTFATMSKYPDDVTYGLVGAASQVLNLPAEQVLEAFGEYWTVYSAEQGYGHLLDFAGSNLVDFLTNLDEMHTRIQMMFPDLGPPSFRVSDVTDSSLRLHYFSSRPGLAPVAKGMVQGLGKRFGTPVDVHLERSREGGHDHDEFLVRFGKPASVAKTA